MVKGDEWVEWVDSLKRWKDVGNLTILSNVRFLILRYLVT